MCVDESGGLIAASTGTLAPLESYASHCSALLGALVDSLEDGVMVVDPNRRVMLINESAASFFGIPRSEIRDLCQVFARVRLLQMNGTPVPESDRPAIKLLQDCPVNRGDFQLVAADGSCRIVNFSGGAVKNAEGVVTSVIVVVHDRTDMAQMEQTGNDYLRFVSHDLRSPLTLISARAQILERSAEHADTVRRNAQAILRASRQMSSMIADLTDSIRLESRGAIPIRSRAFNLLTLLDELVQRWNEASERDRMEACFPSSMPLVYADPDSVERILANLISNALKYSPDEEEVTVSVTVKGDEATISVADNGPGISAEDASHLFERFFRSADARKHHDGLGLGLHISRALAEAQGGRIWAESKPGRGSVFSFTVPLLSSNSRG